MMFVTPTLSATTLKAPMSVAAAEDLWETAGRAQVNNEHCVC